MLERPKLQLFVILLVAVGAGLSFWLNGINLGTDLKGGTQLIYEVDPVDFQGKTEAERNEDMGQVVRIIAARVDPTGAKDIVVTRRGELGLLIELPGMSKQDAQQIEDRITRLGTLEDRLVAFTQYEEDDVTMGDLAAEKQRLEDWLKKGQNRARCLQNPHYIRTFNDLPAEDGGPRPLRKDGKKALNWYPHKVRVSVDNPEVFDQPYSQGTTRFEKSLLHQHVVAVFEQDEYTKGPQTEASWLLEYVPINMDSFSVAGKDYVGSYTRPSTNPQTGRPVVLYQIKPDKAPAYADHSEKYIGFESAIILDGYVESAPYYQSRIPGNGQIQVRTQRQAEQLADVLRRGSLKVRLEQQSKISIGPTLGKRSIELGAISILAGAVIVLAFILFYYRIAGIVACLGIVLNICLVFGVLSFVQATLTLPGLAGLVLTIGMAVDANILIYERIREEIKRGKALLQAVRHGFERAMVTILDANVTTFLAGLVLYNVGVGPIRGFAVTLMIGIVTSVFTAFFLTRLVFHYLLDKDRIQTLKMTEWFSNLRFNFLRFRKVAMAASAVVIIAGLANFFRVDGNTKYGMDFTGGATMHVVTKTKFTPEEITKTLEGNKEFDTRFPAPIINTAGDTVEGNRSDEFVIKLKVTPQDAARIAAERKKAREAGESYRPDYEELVAKALEKDLVSQPFTDVKVTEISNAESAADLVVHYAEPKAVSEIKKLMDLGVRAGYELTPRGTAVDGKHRNFKLGFAVDPNRIKTPEDLRDFTLNLLSPKIIDPTTGLEKVVSADLSDPIPDASEIGGRMVGELRNAAIGAMILSLFLIVMFIRIRFHEYKYGLGAVAALAHDVMVALGVIVAFNALGLVNSELDLAMIAAFLTIIGYSINDTIVIFDRVRENLKDQARLGDTKMSFADTINQSINQTLARTILTSCTTLFVVLAQFIVNKGSGSTLEGLAFALIVGVLVGTYSTIFIASPVVMWLRNREKPGSSDITMEPTSELAKTEESVPASVS